MATERLHDQSIYEFVLELLDTSDVFFSLGIWRESDQDQRSACHPSCHTRGQPLSFKGTVSPDRYFRHSIKFFLFFLCIRCSFSRSFKSFSLYPIQLFTFYLLLLNYLLILKVFTETLLRIPFSVNGQCSQVPSSHWLEEKCTRFVKIVKFWTL